MNIIELLQFANDQTNGFFGIGICILVFSILFINFLREGHLGRALTHSLGLTTVFAILLSAVNLLNPYIVMIFIISTILSIFI